LAGLKGLTSKRLAGNLFLSFPLTWPCLATFRPDLKLLPIALRATIHSDTRPCTNADDHQHCARYAYDVVACLPVSSATLGCGYTQLTSHHLSGLVLGTVSLTSTVPSSFALDKPIYCAIVCLTTLATVLLVLGRLLPKGESISHKGQYTAVPLEEVGSPRDHSSHRFDDVAHPPSLRKLRVLFVVLVLAICARAELARQILLNVQCAHGTWEPIVPLALAAWDCAVSRRRRKHDMELDEQTSTIYDIWERRIMNSPYRYLVVVAIVSFGSLGALRATGSPPSTYICAAALPFTWSVPSAQHSGTALDVLILYCINGLLYSDDERGSRTPSTRFSAIGWVCLVGKESLTYVFASIN
jgi:hypothetical protein